MAPSFFDVKGTQMQEIENLFKNWKKMSSPLKFLKFDFEVENEWIKELPCMTARRVAQSMKI
jgi:hypothetical protein